VVQVSTQDSKLRMRALAKAFEVRDQLPECDENTTLDLRSIPAPTVSDQNGGRESSRPMFFP